MAKKDMSFVAVKNADKTKMKVKVKPADKKGKKK